MTRQDALTEILSIVDGAQPPEVPAIDAPGAAASSRKKSAARQRGADSSSSPAGEDARPDSPTSAGPSLPASAPALRRPSADFAKIPAPSQVGEPAKEAVPEEGGAAAKTDDEIAEERRREEELRREALNAELAHLPMTDLGNVERFRKRFGHMFKWTAAHGWHYWDGRRWARKSAEGRVRIAAHETVRAIQDEAKAMFAEADKIAEEFEAEELAQAEFETSPKKKKDDKATGPRLVYSADDPKAGKGRGKRKKKSAPEAEPLDRKKIERFLKFKRLRGLGMALADWGLDSEMNSKITPIDKHAAPYLAVEIEAFDADPWMINVANGTLVVDRDAPGLIRFKPHDPADLITKISPVDYKPKAGCDQFDAFLQRIQPDEDNRRFLIDWLGYSLTGDATEQQLAVLHGAGGNGKGVIIRIATYIAGDYARATPIETFLAEASPRNASQPTPERAALPGVRMLTASEPEKNAKLDEGFIKLVTGGDMISARDLNKSQFEFMPVFKLTISANHKPRINDQTEGIWRRMNLVPFDVVIPRAEWDLKLDEKLRAEASGVLNVLLDGLRRWLVNGLVRSKASEAATAKYREDSDPLGRFLTDCVERSPGDRVQSTSLHELFIAWARATGAPEWKHTGFTNAMKERGFETKKSNAMFFLDIRATKKVNDFVDHLGKPLAGDEVSHARGDPSDDRGGGDEIGF